MTPKEMKKLRTNNQLTQIDVAVAVGVSVAAYRLWEAGGGNPTAENAVKLEAALGGSSNDSDRKGTKQ